MLADEMPEEFMRRSVMGEHLFWKVAWREPAQTRSTTVLFDAGPEQLGALPEFQPVRRLVAERTALRPTDAPGAMAWLRLELDRSGRRSGPSEHDAARARRYASFAARGWYDVIREGLRTESVIERQGVIPTAAVPVFRW